MNQPWVYMYSPDHKPRLDAWDKCSGLVHWEDSEGLFLFFYWSMVGLQTFPSSRRSESWKFPPDCMSLCWDRVYGKSVSQPLQPFCCGYFLVDLMHMTLSASLSISFRGSCSMCTCRCDVPIEGSKCRSLPCPCRPGTQKFRKIKERGFVRSFREIKVDI